MTERCCQVGPCRAPEPRRAWPSQCWCGWLLAEHTEKDAQDLEQEKARVQ